MAARTARLMRSHVTRSSAFGDHAGQPGGWAPGVRGVELAVRHWTWPRRICMGVGLSHYYWGLYAVRGQRGGRVQPGAVGLAGRGGGPVSADFVYADGVDG